MKKLVVLDPDRPQADDPPAPVDRVRDRFDEVWNGVYVMAPIADNEHQDLADALLAHAFIAALGKASRSKVVCRRERHRP